MSRVSVMAATVSLLVLALSAILTADEMSLQDVIALKQAGFSDAEVIAELARSGGRIDLGGDAIERLRTAGAGDELIDSLRPAISIDEVVKMIKNGASTEEILDAIAAAGTGAPLSAEDARLLTRERAPLAVIVALKRKPLDVQALRTLAEAETTVAVFGALVKVLGFATKGISADESRSLARAGVPASVLKQYREATAVQPPVIDAPPQVDLSGTWVGTGTFGPMVQDATLWLGNDGTYRLVIAHFLMQGRWSTEQPNFLVFVPEGYPRSADEYELVAGTLRIHCADGAFLSLRRK